MFSKQIEEMKLIVTEAIKYIQSDNLTKAKALLAKLHHYHPITEQNRCIAIIESLILLRRRKKRKAKNLILMYNYEAWDSPDLQDILRLCNPPVDYDSRIFSMTILGGYATFGTFTQFSAEHICDLKVIANSKAEAFGYAVELCRFAVADEACILNFEQSNTPPDPEEHRGIVSTSPFRLATVDNLSSTII